MERWREGDGKDGSDGGQGGIYSRYVIMLTDVEPFANDKILEDYLQVKTWMSKCIRLVTRLVADPVLPEVSALCVFSSDYKRKCYQVSNCQHSFVTVLAGTLII